MTTESIPSTGDRTAHQLNLRPLDAIPCDGDGCGAVATRLVARSVYPPIDDYLAEQTPTEICYRSMRRMLCEECCRKAMGWTE
jgi:hypothetical protein